MKTWVFTKDSLSAEINRWVQQQIDSGHPKAIANVDFVAEAIVAFLENASLLHRTYDLPKTQEDAKVATPDYPPWEDTDITCMSPAYMLKLWEQSK